TFLRALECVNISAPNKLLSESRQRAGSHQQIDMDCHALESVQVERHSTNDRVINTGGPKAVRKVPECFVNIITCLHKEFGRAFEHGIWRAHNQIIHRARLPDRRTFTGATAKPPPADRESSRGMVPSKVVVGSNMTYPETTSSCLGARLWIRPRHPVDKAMI